MTTTLLPPNRSIVLQGIQWQTYQDIQALLTQAQTMGETSWAKAVRQWTQQQLALGN